MYSLILHSKPIELYVFATIYFAKKHYLKLDFTPLLWIYFYDAVEMI